MRILILGVTGMFGSAAYRVFASDAQHETWGTMRSANAKRFFEESAHSRLIDSVDVTDQNALVEVLDSVRPDLVINAVGVIKQLAGAHEPRIVLPINALFPHALAGLCSLVGARLVHVSTDCVFSGRSGNYVESDLSDAEDLYGKSKYIGEIADKRHVITLRTSGIGHELQTQNGLLEWFLSQEGRVKGYRKAIYSGLPWTEFARVIKEKVVPNQELHGLYHVGSKPIAKADLLALIAHTYGKDIVIEPDDSVRIDRSLNATRFADATGYVAAEWPELITDMYDHRS